MPYIECKQVVKVYKVGDHELVSLKGIDFSMEQGELVAIIGPSGAGKSTLLNLLGGLDRPTAGQLYVDGQNLLNFKPHELAHYRLHRVGFVWQQVERNLFAHRSAIRNVTLPMMMGGLAPWKRNGHARDLLTAVGMSDHLRKHPGQLSGGQQQRVAIAVALANTPPLLLADEPTGSLDRETSRQVMLLLNELRQKFNLTVLMVTHDMEIAEYADRVLTLRDGALGQDLSGGSDDAALNLDPEGRLQLPQEVRATLNGAARIAVEVRPEGVLLRPESEEHDETEALLQEMLPQDAAPIKRGLFGRFRRKSGGGRR
ncbi:MAG: ABC transporter ATP-binding protein [Anaerolineae bacterium]|jgi:ABC-type lipoprotein export system ATPase subunit|nr:ABC transporter ATP-binding protein [Anaerolineae bacterium]